MKHNKEQETKEIMERIANSLDQMIKLKKACQKKTEKQESNPDQEQPEKPRTDTPTPEHPEKPQVPTEEENPPVYPPVKHKSCKKLAVVVGINDYPGRRADLTGPVFDANGIAKKLIKEFGYEKKNILFLTDNAATKASILKGLTWLQKELKKGDAGVFYFSGHGTQVADQAGGDEQETDKLDEVIVPYDSIKVNPFRGRIEIAPGNLIRDDEIAAILKGIAAGVNFSVIFDCCHSGTATKGFGRTIGKSLPFSSHVQNLISLGWIQRSNQKTFLLNAGNYVFLSASKANETALDTGLKISLYTRELLKSIKKGITYQQLHDRASKAVIGATITDHGGHKQTPQIEGPLNNWKIFECP